jgi:acyl-CoA synthetase (AMP-forming)/AMP-acid ligase II
MKRCFTGGAPVSVELCNTLLKAFPGVEGYAVYGSTEAEPMAKAKFEDVVRLEGKGEGFLAGKVAPVAEIVVAQFPEEPPKLGPDGMTPFSQAQGELGEIVVRGNHVNRGYIDNPQANLENKIPETDGSIWHRTGDVGYFDEEGMLWLTGRVKDAVSHFGRMIQPLPIEAALDGLEEVVRSAIVSSQKAPNGHVFIQPAQGQDTESLEKVVLKHIIERGLDAMQVEFIDKMAVDGRHNSKIDRPTLREMIDNR